MNVKAQISITMTEDGKTRLQAHGVDKLEALGLLEMAKHILLTQKEPGIVEAHAVPVLLNGARG